MSDTPETDAVLDEESLSPFACPSLSEHSRRLERQRDALVEALREACNCLRSYVSAGQADGLDINAVKKGEAALRAIKEQGNV